MKILIADDDPQLQRALRITLSSKGYTILAARNGAEAIALAIDEKPDLYLVDLGMPQVEGLDVIHSVRQWSGAPMLVLSGRTDAADKVEALDAGADDYITKPFSVQELLARIRAVNRRLTPSTAEAGPRIVLGDVVIDRSGRTVIRHDGDRETPIRLTPTEWQVLDVLARHPGQLITRQTLLTEIWGPEHLHDTGYLRIYLSQLRKKLEPDPAHPRYLITESGMGYRLVTPTSGPEAAD